MITLADIQAAAAAVAPYCIRTPQRPAPVFSKRLGLPVQLKLELEQHSGSFKTRGAFYQMQALGEAALAQGVVAVSGGNFARAVGYCSGILGVDAIICMPENAPESSIQATKDYGATVELLPDTAAAFQRAEEWVARGRSALHPFDNKEQVAGNGIIALEIIEDWSEMTDIIVSIGGGGLIAGIISALQAVAPKVRVWGVEPRKAPTMQFSLAADALMHIKPISLSKTLGAPFVSQTALDLCREHLEELVAVSDLQMIAAQQIFIREEKLQPELAAASTLAAAGRIKDYLPSDSKLVLLVCGGNDSPEDIAKFSDLLADELEQNKKMREAT